MVHGAPRARFCSNCGEVATHLCDWKVRIGRCDALVCERCLVAPRPGAHLCAVHGGIWRAREAFKAKLREVAAEPIT